MSLKAVGLFEISWFVKEFKVVRHA